MGRSLEPAGLQLSSRGRIQVNLEQGREKAHQSPDRLSLSAIDDKLRRVLVLNADRAGPGDRGEETNRVTVDMVNIQEEAGRPAAKRRRRWPIRCWRRVGRGKLVTPVVRHLKRFRLSCTSVARFASNSKSPLRLPGWKLGLLLSKLHLSRKRNSRKIHSILSCSSASTDEQAPLLALCDP